jgi:hypothetical protein
MGDILKDAAGHVSSKRIAGFLGFIVMAGVSIYAIITDPSAISQILWPWAVFVGAVFGVTVLEKK